MHVCQTCAQELADPAEDPGFGFPSCTVAGGAIGVLGALALGTVLLLPAALVIGALLDSRWCDSCGTPIGEGEDRFRVMEASDDDIGGTTFSPVQAGQGRAAAANRSASARPLGATRSQAAVERPSPGGRPADVMADRDAHGALDDVDHAGDRIDDDHHADENAVYRFDELMGRLVPESDADPMGLPELGDDWAFEPPAGQPDGSLDTPLTDGLSDAWEDAIDWPEPFPEPDWGAEL